MRIVATSDTHFHIPEDFIPDGDVFIHAGDLMYSGYVNEWYDRLECLARLPHAIKLYVPGNHDLHVELFAGPALQELRSVGVTVLGIPHVKPNYTLPNGKTVLGLPFVTNLPRWAFNREEEWLEQYMAQFGRHHIVVSHSPPKTILDGDNFGVVAYLRYLRRFQPEYWICGHVHEDHGEAAKDGCIIYNVCAQNRAYTEFANPPTIIDL